MATGSSLAQVERWKQQACDSGRNGPINDLLKLSVTPLSHCRHTAVT
jgi:hypothetical protein